MSSEDLNRIDRPTNAQLAAWKEMISEENEDCIGAGSISMLIAEVERLRTWQIEAVTVITEMLDSADYWAKSDDGAPCDVLDAAEGMRRVLASAPEVKP